MAVRVGGDDIDPDERRPASEPNVATGELGQDRLGFLGVWLVTLSVSALLFWSDGVVAAGDPED